MIFSTAVTGLQDMRLPQWGRAFWQDPNDGELFLAYASGTSEVNFITSDDDGLTWSAPTFAFPVDDFSTHNNFDVVMDRKGHIHCGFRFNASGCYTIIGKLPGGGWTTASGVGAVGWISAGDSGVAKGFQGSLTMHEAPFIFDVGGVVYPAVKMVAKDSGNFIHPAYLGFPYTSTPILEVINFGATPNGGTDGGFPIIFTDGPLAGSTRGTKVVYFDHDTYDLGLLERGFGGYDDFGTLGFSQGDVLFSPNMGIGSGVGPVGNTGFTVVATASGQAVWSNVDTTGFGNTFLNTTDFNEGTDKYWRAQTGFEGGDPSGLLANSGVIPTGLIYGVGPNVFSGSGVTIHDFPGGGTNCDWTFNDNGEYILYFQKKNEWGRQSIGRIKGKLQNELLLYTELSDPDFGLKHPAEVSRTQTGGWSNTLFWGGFKALKHPTEPSIASGKLELLVTQGHVATFPSGGILTVWDVQNSPALARFQTPEYSIDYTATSGTAREIFLGIAAFTNVQLTSHLEISPNFFDDDNTSFGRIRDGYTLTLEMDRIRTIDRIEILDRTLTTVPSIAFSGSMDGINHVRVATLPSGRHVDGFNELNGLRKLQSAGQTATVDANKLSNQPIFNLDPFTAKILTLQFDHSTSSSARIYEIKLYGPAASAPEIITWGDTTADPPEFNRTLFYQSKALYTEEFRMQQGSVPIGWRTYGDFEWRTVGSGESTRTSFSPTSSLPDDYNGLVQSGFWQYYEPARGVGDGYSIRSEAVGDSAGLGSPLGPVPVGGIQPGHTGVLEVEFNILEEERVGNFGVPSREIAFYLRSDVHNEDRIEFYHIGPLEVDTPGATGTLMVQYQDFSWSAPAGSNHRFASRQEFIFTGEGKHRIRWIYRKGINDTTTQSPLDKAPVMNALPYGACWIDQVAGLDSRPGRGSPRHGFLRGANFVEQTLIHGYLEGKGFSQIHGVLPLVDPMDGFILGYLSGSQQAGLFDTSSTIHGYTIGKGLSIHGYVLGSPSGGIVETTFPTGSIHGFVQVLPSGASSAIHGYVLPYNQSTIWGYLLGNDDITNVVPTGDLQIHGYTLANYPNSIIYGLVNGSGENVATESIHGFLQSRFGLDEQIIHGYVGGVPGEDGANIRKGFTLGWNEGPDFFRDPQTMIYGYLHGPKSSGTFQVHGYALANKPNDAIHGYLGNEALVESGGGSVGGGPGGGGESTSNVIPGTNWVHGYLKGVDGFQFIHGYLKGPPGAVSERKGYVLGGAENSEIHGYTKSVEIASGIIHGYASGIGYEDTSIHGWMFGISGIISSAVHGYLAGVEEPNSMIWGTLIGTLPPFVPPTGSTEPFCPSSADLCPSHNFPLPPLPTIVLPTGFLN